jgi:mitochondrial fission protein ELM1
MVLNPADLPAGDIVVSSYAALLVQMQRRCAMMRKCVGLMKEDGLFVTNSFLLFRPKEQSETMAILYIIGATKSIPEGFGAFSRELKRRYRETKKWNSVATRGRQQARDYIDRMEERWNALNEILKTAIYFDIIITSGVYYPKRILSSVGARVWQYVSP